MLAPLDVARYLIKLAAAGDGEDADLLSHMRLQKLLYYAQGWHLAAFGVPLFRGRIGAWKYGPVVEDLYDTFKGYGAAGIRESEGDAPGSIGPTARLFLESVWQEYGRYSATALRDMTHAEAPWIDARGGTPPADRCYEEITHDAMRAFFSQQVAAKTPLGIDFRSVYRGVEQLRLGKTRTSKEVFARLG